MFKLLFLLFIIKLYARSNVFQFIKKKHEQDITAVHKYEENFHENTIF